MTPGSLFENGLDFTFSTGGYWMFAFDWLCANTQKGKTTQHSLLLTKFYETGPIFHFPILISEFRTPIDGRVQTILW